ncbi:MAG TPA: hypothetical protein VHU18_13150 [Rhizomicrobium sp.]|nr:hypothetical protein [Rhizomicrobium sp.]
MHAFAQLTVPEIEAGLAAVVALGATIIALFVVLAMMRACAQAVARRISNLGRSNSTVVTPRRELAPERAG